MKMTIAKALRYKKRVISKIQTLEADIIANNSILEAAEREVEVPEALGKREKTITHLIDVKLAISTASAPIQRMILECAEAKSYISFLRSISVDHGLKGNSWGDELATYTAQIRKKERDAQVLAAEDRIDGLQSEIDAFNNGIKVEIKELD